MSIDQILFNTRERLISDDLNRLQKVTGAIGVRALRMLVNDRRYQHSISPGYTEERGSNLSLESDVWAGLLIVPSGASFTIGAGVAGFHALSADMDEDPYTFAFSDGGGPFAFSATGASVRFDYVEARPVQTVTETGTRYIKDLVSGLWAPALVNKRTQATLEFRYRTGAAGGGPPALDTAWLPIACIVVTPGATSFDQCDVFDLRPLVQERIHFQAWREPYGTIVGSDGRMITNEITALSSDVTPPTATMQAYGYARAVGMGGYEAGGNLFKNTPSAVANFGGGTTGEALYLNLDSSENGPGTYSMNALVTLYAAFPMGLPRWVRYTEALSVSPFSGRIPYGSNGWLIASQVYASLADGSFPTVTIPAWLTSGGMSVPSIALGHVHYESGGYQWIPGLEKNGVKFQARTQGTMISGGAAAPSQTLTFPDDGIWYPRDAKTLRVNLTIDSDATPAYYTAYVRTSSGLTFYSTILNTDSSGNAQDFSIEIPTIGRGQNSSTSRLSSFNLVITAPSGNIQVGANVVGWSR